MVLLNSIPGFASGANTCRSSGTATRNNRLRLALNWPLKKNTKVDPEGGRSLGFDFLEKRLNLLNKSFRYLNGLWFLPMFKLTADDSDAAVGNGRLIT